jgi:hypothetical protein
MPEKINSTGVIQTGISDHSLIYGIRKINPIVSTRNMTRNVEVRNMKRFNHNSFREDLLAQPWEQIVLESYTDSMWALWKKLFLEVLDKHAPVQRIRKRKSGVPWLTGEIKKIIFERDKLKRKAMVTGSRAAWDKYNSTRNKVNIALYDKLKQIIFALKYQFKIIIQKRLGRQSIIYSVVLQVIPL